MVRFLISIYFRPEVWPHIAAVILGLAVIVKGLRHPWLFALLGGFLLGQLIGATALAGWDAYAVLALSAALGAVTGALSLVTARPLAMLASFSGVGFLAFALCGIFGVGSPWSLAAYVVAGAVGAAALFVSFERALAVNVALASGAAVASSLGLWLPIVKNWGGWTELAVTAVVVVVGLIHHSRELPTAAAAPVARGVPGRAG